MTETFPLEFQSAEERTAFIKANADYYTIAWKQDRKYQRFEYNTLNIAREQAQFAADIRNHPVMIYAVVCPFSNMNEPYGYSSWVETVKPNARKHNSPNKLENT